MRSISLPAIGRAAAAGLALLVAACSGGGGSSSSTPVTAVTPPTVAPAAANVVALLVDQGPAALNTGANGYTSDNAAFVTVTVCAPGTSNCQTIDHVLVDTGSVGLRIAQGVLGASLAAALPLQVDAASNPVGECYGFVDGYAFGTVHVADFTVGGEHVAAIPLQVIGDRLPVPASCSSGGGSNLVTVHDLGANGILGIGVTATDCGADCARGDSAAATYYDCPPSGCAMIIARAAATAVPFEQLPNPVAAMAVDNNGTVIALPAVPDAGAPTLTGTLTFGIGTQANNGLGSATVLATTSSLSAGGPGLLTIVYRAASLPNSYVDSGSNSYFFADPTIAACTDSDLTGYYCPPTPVSIAPVFEGRNGQNVTVPLIIANAKPLLLGPNTALPGIAADPGSLTKFNAYPRSFAAGLPFFYGRTVFTAIEGRTAGGATGPYVAF